jgi:YHS domain-containing protein
MRSITAALLIALATTAAVAQNAPAPEECVAKRGDASAVVVAHDGKSYRLANDACRAEFLTDPERYAQLYDALLELEKEGTRLAAPAAPSLVPS